MNIVTPVTEKQPDRQEAEVALAVLRSWAASVDASERETLDPALAILLAEGAD